jgi:hypothetical protein
MESSQSKAAGTQKLPDYTRAEANTLEGEEIRRPLMSMAVFQRNFLLEGGKHLRQGLFM